MEPLYIGITIAALIIIVVVLLISREKGKQLRKPSIFVMVGMTLGFLVLFSLTQVV